MGFGHPTAYDAFLADATEEHSGDDMDEDAPPVTAVPATTSKSHLPEFLDMIGAATITTDFLMVSFIPDRIKPEAFAQLMDTITLSVVSATTYHQARTPVYKRPGFLEFFATKPPLWMVLFDAAEQHGSFLLPLPVTLTFSPVGGPNGLQPPRFFTVPLNKRTCLVQAVPPFFKPVFTNSPELAIWRGLGADLSAGHHFVLTAAIDAHVTKTLKDCVASGELTSPVQHFTYLAPHYVNIQEDTAPSKPTNPKGRGPQPKTPLARHSWTECFVVTVSTIPVGRDSAVFQALLPPEAPFGTKMHSINLFGWRGEVASHLSLFRSWKYSPDPSLLLPQPTMRFTALRPGYSLPSLCEILQHDFQTLEGVLFCFIQRGSTDTFFLVTDGRSISVTPSLRAISYGGGMLDPDLPGMIAQRTFYRHFNPVLLPSPANRGNSTLTTRSAPPPQLESSLRSYARQETRLVIQELSTTLSQEASSMVTNAMAPLKEELRKAHAEIEALKGDLATQSTQTQNTLKIVSHHSSELQSQKAKDLEIQRLLYSTMKSAGLPLPDDADTVLGPHTKRRLSPTSDSSPMESSDG